MEIVGIANKIEQEHKQGIQLGEGTQYENESNRQKYNSVYATAEVSLIGETSEIRLGCKIEHSSCGKALCQYSPWKSLKLHIFGHQ